VPPGSREGYRGRYAPFLLIARGAVIHRVEGAAVGEVALVAADRRQQAGDRLQLVVAERVGREAGGV